MGWTGTYCWWHNRETNLEIFKRVYSKSLTGEIEEGKSKICQRGSDIYVLFPTNSGKNWVACYLCQRNKKDHEFLTKDIDAITNNCFDFPKSWIKYLPQDDEDVKNYIRNRQEYENKKKVSYKANFGDIFECTAQTNINWNDGFSIYKGHKFYVRVKVHNPYSKRKTKDYVVTKQEICDGRITYRDMFRRIGNGTFKSSKGELVVRG